MRRLIVLASLLALVATACKLETNFGAVINADGSGTIVVEIGVDDEAAETIFQGENPLDGNELAATPGARTREERRGDLTFYIVEIDVDDITDAEQQLLDSDDSLLSNLEITVTDSLVTVTGSTSVLDSLGGDTGDFDLGLLEDAISANVYFTLPGSILTHNADRRDGNTLFWEVPVLEGTLDIRAESDPTGTPASSSSSDGFPVWAYGIIAAVLLGALYYFRKGKSGGGDSASDDAPPPPPAE